MLEIYFTAHRHFIKRLHLQNSTFETTHSKQLLVKTFVMHTYFEPVKLSNKLKHLCPYKKFQHLSEVIYEFMTQDDSTVQTHRSHILHHYPKELVIFPYISQYHYTSSLLRNPGTDSYQDDLSQSFHSDQELTTGTF